jgi:hypothetical protein
LAKDVFDSIHKSKLFIPGKTPIPATGKFFGAQELSAAIIASGEFWLTSGRHTEEFESRLAKQVGVRHAFMVNSGSFANLIAISTLTSKKLGERRLMPGDEVLTVAAGFPTTVAPIEDIFTIKERNSEFLSPGPGFHLAFSAPSCEAIGKWHKRGIELGAIDKGEPKIWTDFGPHYYAAYLTDPDGWQLEAVFKTNL